MMSKSKVPQIRFKGFNEVINSKKLEEVVISNIYGPRFNANDYDVNGNVKTIRGTDISLNGDIIYNQVPRAKLDSNFISGHILQDGDLVMITTADCGLTGIFEEQKEKFICSAYAVKITLNKELTFPNYFKYFFQTKMANKEINKFIRKATVSNLPASDILKIKHTIPSKIEQKNIAMFFDSLYKLIEQKEKKYQKLKQFKKAMLDKMFPKNGADTPEIRFKGFIGKWEEKKLGQLAKITTGSSNRQDSGLDGKYTFFDRSDDIRTSNIYLFDGEAVIVAGEGSDFVPKYFKGKFDLHQRTYAIMNFENGDSKFLFYYIHLFRKWFLNQAVGSTVKSLRLPMFQEMVIKYPRKEEQEKIGNYFQKLDKQIDLLQKELDKLKNIKKASLAKMFV